MYKALAIAAALAIAGLPLTTGATAARAAGPLAGSGPAGGSATVSTTQQLVDQTVHVSWQGFKPSSTTVVQPGTTFPVRVYQCRGVAPAGPEDCYGSSLYTYPGQTDVNFHRPDGPPNFVDATTGADGRGSAEIETRTVLESSTLGCDKDHACSIAVVPNYGDPAHHDFDFVYATNAYMDAPWSWANHITVPISFAPTGLDCPLGDAGITSAGSPLSQRAITSWQPAACQGAESVNIDYTAVGEQQGRAQFLGGGMDLGLTTLPADPGAVAAHAFAYAPIDVGAVAVSFHVDDADTGQPITTLKLNARLIAKLLTESYGGVGYVPPGSPVGNGNPATVGNPPNIFADPEFLALNPGHSWPSNSTNPLLVSGNTDLIWEMTRWIAGDSVAAGFLSGTPDSSGMHVNTNFKGIVYPVSAVELRDPYPAYTYTYVPLNGLDLVARSLVVNQPSSSNPVADALGRHTKEPQQPPGRRALIAIVDSASAAAFNFPVASLKNAAGAYTMPTADAMAASVTAMTVNPDKVTRQANFAATDPAIYPLTMIGYAMVPTSGTSAAKITQVVRFLTYAVGPGQQPSVGPGGLPTGYLALPASLIAQTKAAVTAVQAQSGTRPAAAASPSPASSSSGGGAPSSGSGATRATPHPAKSTAQSSQPIAASAAPRATTTTSVTPGPPWYVRLALPLLLGLGLAATLGGPALLALGTGGLPPWLPRWAAGVAPAHRRKPGE